MAGTLGTAIAEEHHRRGDKVVGCSRNELNCIEWQKQYRDVGRLYVADAFDLCNASWINVLHGCERVYHCAALKHVDVCEKQPWEAMNQNVDLTISVVAACKKVGAKITLASTDKACRPDSVYGATKLMAERIVLNAGGTVVRLGNLIGSSGSVFQTWKAQVERGEPITLTDPNMTRFFIPVDEAAEYLINRVDKGRWIPDVLKSAQMGAVASRLAGDIWSDKVTITGLRSGETLHQWITEDKSSFTAERWDVDELLREAGVKL